MLTTLKQHCVNVSILRGVRCRFQITTTSLVFLTPHTPVWQACATFTITDSPLHYNVTFLHLCWELKKLKSFFNSTYFLIIPIQFQFQFVWCTDKTNVWIKIVFIKNKKVFIIYPARWAKYKLYLYGSCRSQWWEYKMKINILNYKKQIL